MIGVKGEQPFEVVMKVAKLNLIIKMPLVHAAVKSDFTNIGSVLGAIGCR